MSQSASEIHVEITLLPHAQGLEPPKYGTADAAGCDLVAAVDAAVEIAPGARALIPTGIAIALPPGFEAQVRPRSGLALKNGITVVNAPGTVDADYRGEVGVILMNTGSDIFIVERGMRIAQMVAAPVTRIAWKPVETLPPSDRGSGGVGAPGGG